MKKYLFLILAMMAYSYPALAVDDTVELVTEVIELEAQKLDILDENLVAPLWFCCPGDPDGYEAPERDIGSDQLTPNRVPFDVASNQGGSIMYAGYFWANNGPEDPDG